MSSSFASGPVSSLSLTSDGQLLAAITDHDNVSFATATVPPSSESLPVSPLPTRISASSLTALAFPHHACLYTADARGALSRYDVSTQHAKQIYSIQGAHSGVELTTVAALSPTSLVLTGGKDGVIRVWDPHSKNSLVKLTGHRYDVRCISVASSHDDHVDTPVTIVASAGRDRTVRLWDVRQPASSNSLHVFKGHSGWVHSVSLADGYSPVAVSCSGDRTVRVWDLRTMSERVVFKGHHYRIWAVAASAEGAFAVSGSTDATVRAWPLAHGFGTPHADAGLV